MSSEKANSLREKDSGSESNHVVSYHHDGIVVPPPITLTEEQKKKLWRKIDLRILPILSLLYLFSFLDRGNIGNARLQGLTKQLHLDGNKFNIALTMFIIPYCVFECPANLVLKRLRPSRWLPGITIVWGIVMTLMGIVKTYEQLVVTRVLLGVAEAGLFPGVVYYLSIWYPRHYLQFRIGLFFGAASLAGAFSGLFAYAISFMQGRNGLQVWSWIFIIEGIATVAVGLLALFVLVDFPDTAGFLTPEERAYVIWRKKYDNSSVGEEEKFAARHVWAAIKDWQVWLHILIYMSIVAPLYGITLFLPTIINAWGHPPAITQLLSVPPYIVATCGVLTCAYYSDKLKMRSPFIYGGLILCLVGFTINISNVGNNTKYAGTFFIVTGSYSSFPGVVVWLGNNLSGQYKRGVGMALQIGIGNFAAAIAANIYRTQDKPRFILGHALELMFVGIGFICIPIAVFAYTRINGKRDMAAQQALEKGETNKYTDQELRELGDRAPDFRYTI